MSLSSPEGSPIKSTKGGILSENKRIYNGLSRSLLRRLKTKEDRYLRLRKRLKYDTVTLPNNEDPNEWIAIKGIFSDFYDIL
jgi:hypothetical protein